MSLLRHDWLILRNSVGDVFDNWRDRALLALGAAVGVAWLVKATQGPAAPVAPQATYVLLAVAALAGFSAYQTAAMRLQYFIEHSPLCADALMPAGRRAFQMLWQAMTSVIVMSASAIILARTGDFGFRQAAAGLAAQSAGVIASWAFLKLRTAVGSILPRGMTRQSSFSSPKSVVSLQWWSIIARRQIILCRSGPAALAVAAAIGLAVFSAASAIPANDRLGAWIAAGAVATLGTLLLSRIDEQMVHFSAFSGTGRWAGAIAHWPMPIAFAGGVGAVVIAQGLGRADIGPPMLAVGLATGTAIFIVTARVWQCRLMSLASADRTLSIEAAACMMLGLLFWPLALGWAGLRLVQLYRRTGAATWALP